MSRHLYTYHKLDLTGQVDTGEILTSSCSHWEYWYIDTGGLLGYGVEMPRVGVLLGGRMELVF